MLKTFFKDTKDFLKSNSKIEVLGLIKVTVMCIKVFYESKDNANLNVVMQVYV